MRLRYARGARLARPSLARAVASFSGSASGISRLAAVAATDDCV